MVGLTREQVRLLNEWSIGIGNRSFNNVQCQNIATKKRKWLDSEDEQITLYNANKESEER